MTEKQTKRVQVATTVDAETHAALTAIRWDRKIDKFSDVVREAVEEYVAKHGKITSEANGK